MITYKFTGTNGVDVEYLTDGHNDTVNEMLITEVRGLDSSEIQAGFDFDIYPYNEVEFKTFASNNGLSLLKYEDTNLVDVLGLSTPVLTAPADAATDVAVDVTLMWDVVDGAEEYDVYLWETSGSEPGTPTATVSTNSYDTSALTNATEYSWKVVAKNGTVLSTASETRTFTTIA